MTDSTNLIRLIQETQPDEIYNLAAQSHVQVSFESPEYTADVDAMGALRMLEAIRILGLEKKARFYQASTSELYGKVVETPQSETTPFYPRSPYAAAKLYAYWITVNYREAYNMYATNGILFNHESPRRGETFVTRKITRAAVRIAAGIQEKTFLGNLNAKRDWGHAKDYVKGMWLMLQQDEPEDFVLATGFMRNDGVLDDILPLNIPITPNYLLNVYLKEVLDNYNRDHRMGTIFTTSNRNWEFVKRRTVEQIHMSRSIAVDMESATVATNGYRYRIPNATMLCVSDKPLHGKPKLSDEAQNFYENSKQLHIEMAVEALDMCKANYPEGLPNASIRAMNEPLMGGPDED